MKNIQNEKAMLSEAMGMDLEKLAREKKQAEEQLQSLKNKKAAQILLDAAQKSLDDCTHLYEKALEAEEQAMRKMGIEPLGFRIVDEETGQEHCEKRKLGFVRNNRPVDDRKVGRFTSLIRQGKYEKAYPIIVARGEDLVAAGYELCDIHGNTIAPEDEAGYFVVLDGQHRGKAYALLAAAGEDVEVPNVRLRNPQDVGEYLVDINTAGTSWSSKDKSSVAALTTKNERPLFQAIAELIAKGYNPSTAALIFCGRKISGIQLNHALRGNEVTLPREAKVDIERGQRFVDLCAEAGITPVFATKRYFIEGFNAYATSVGDERAFEALTALSGKRLNESQLREVRDSNDFITLLRSTDQAD